MHLVVQGSCWRYDSFSKINRHLVLALDKLGYDVRFSAWHNWEANPHEDFIDFARLESIIARPLDVGNAIVVHHSWPKCDPHYSEIYNWSRIEGARKVGFLCWESDRFPAEWRGDLATVEAIATISPMAIDRINRSLSAFNMKVPLINVPLGVDRRVFRESSLRNTEYRSARGTRFLHLGVGQPRKGSDLLRRAYFEEFSASDDVTLIVKTGGWDKPEDWISPQPRAPHVIVEKRDNLTDNEIASRIASCQYLVSPSVLEGFNLCGLEAMACGATAIMTGEGAHRVYADESNAVLLPYEARPFDFFGITSIAHVPTVDGIRRALRAAHEGQQAGHEGALEGTKEKRLIAGLKTAKQFSWANSAIALIKGIEAQFGCALQRR